LPTSKIEGLINLNKEGMVSIRRSI